MPRIEFCTFCGHEIAPGKGLDFIKNDATIYHFCSNKCKVNLLKLKRNILKSFGKSKLSSSRMASSSLVSKTDSNLTIERCAVNNI